MSPVLAADASAIAKIVFFIVIAIIAALKSKKSRTEPRKLPEGHGVPHPHGPPPTVPWPKPQPAPPAPRAEARKERSAKPLKPVTKRSVATEKAAAKAVARAEHAGEAPSPDFDAARDLTKRTAAVVGGTAARPAMLLGRALLRAGDVPRRERIRAAILWAEVLGPPISRRGPRPALRAPALRR